MNRLGWQELTDLSDRPVPARAAAGAAVLVAAAVLLAVARRARAVRTGRGHRLETVLTVAAAGIATGVSTSACEVDAQDMTARRLSCCWSQDRNR